MWKIKDPALKDKINQLVVSDDRIAACCREQMKDQTDFILLESEVFKLSMRVDKDYFEEVPEYNPDGWNPYPQLTPPRSGLYFIYRTYEFENKITVDRYEEGKYGGRWSETAVKSILAFKECHLGKPEFLP